MVIVVAADLISGLRDQPLKFLRASPGAASPLSFIVLSMLVWELSLKGFLGQDSTVFDDLGDPSGAFEDLGGSLLHSK